MLLPPQGYSQQVAEPEFEPRQAVFRAALSHPLPLSEHLVSDCEPCMVFATKTASPEDPGFKINDAPSNHNLQDDHAGITVPFLRLEKLRFKEVKGMARGPRAWGSSRSGIRTSSSST